MLTHLVSRNAAAAAVPRSVSAMVGGGAVALIDFSCLVSLATMLTIESRHLSPSLGISAIHTAAYDAEHLSPGATWACKLC